MNGFQINPYLQDKMTYAGQLDCYGQCNEILKKFLGIDVSVMQIHRVTNTYRGFLEQDADPDPLPEEVMTLKEKEPVYVLTDGSMVLIREEGWSVVKLGRIFQESESMKMGNNEGGYGIPCMKPIWAAVGYFPVGLNCLTYPNPGLSGQPDSRIITSEQPAEV